MLCKFFSNPNHSTLLRFPLITQHARSPAVAGVVQTGRHEPLLLLLIFHLSLPFRAPLRPPPVQPLPALLPVEAAEAPQVAPHQGRACCQAVEGLVAAARELLAVGPHRHQGWPELLLEITEQGGQRNEQGPWGTEPRRDGLGVFS